MGGSFKSHGSSRRLFEPHEPLRMIVGGLESQSGRSLVKEDGHLAISGRSHGRKVDGRSGKSSILSLLILLRL